MALGNPQHLEVITGKSSTRDEFPTAMLDDQQVCQDAQRGYNQLVKKERILPLNGPGQINTRLFAGNDCELQV